MKRLILFVAMFVLYGASFAYALENDVAREEMPSQDANLTSDSLHREPSEQPPIPTGPSTYVGDRTAPAVEADVNAEVKEKNPEETPEIKVYVPKSKRHVWKDENLPAAARTA